MAGRVYCVTDLDRQLLIDEFDNRLDAENALDRALRRRSLADARIGILSFDAAGRQIGSPIMRIPPVRGLSPR